MNDLAADRKSQSAPEDLDESKYWHKRPMDLAILIISHLVLLPIWLILWTMIPLAIWLEDRGPVFYIQDRMGLKGKRFKIYKFRSMRVSAGMEEWNESTSTDDQRVTKIGRVLRETALDELPQVINILKGDITFVGPRALPPMMHYEDAQIHPEFHHRLKTKPGLTGLTVYLPRQVNPKRRLKYDLLYIKRADLWLDVRLIMFSAWLTLSRKWGKDVRQGEMRNKVKILPQRMGEL